MAKEYFSQIFTTFKEKLLAYWHSFYFHWQLKDKTSFAVISAFLIIIIAIPLSTYNLVNMKKVNQEIKCLALNIFHEARSESEKGQKAVASVTLNRVDSKRYPDTVCEVVYQKRWDTIRKRYVSQFSWTEFDEPPSLKSKPWYRAWRIAEESYRSSDKQRLEGALYYHARRIRPSWARTKTPVARIGRHIFYR